LVPDLEGPIPITVISKGMSVLLIASKVVLIKNMRTVSFFSLVYVFVHSAMWGPVEVLFEDVS
jgi:hypothetical protein